MNVVYVTEQNKTAVIEEMPVVFSQRQQLNLVGQKQKLDS